MQYRNFGKLDWQVSALGFGAMRLPIIGEDSGAIDEPEATRMIRHAIDEGVNYVDTAWGYHRENSEKVIGRVLQDGYREKVRLATKMPSWLIKSQADMDYHLEEQLNRLQTDHIDFYLLHSLDRSRWENLRDLEVFAWAEKQRAAGKFRYLGFSFHDKYPVFDEILSAYDWDFCQIQYNYMDIHEQAGMKGLRQAAERGIAVVIMEGLQGGNLAKDPAPPEVQKIFDASDKGWTPAEWALQWLWDQPEVAVVLSGMTTMEQVEQNLATASKGGVGTMSEEDKRLVLEVQKVYKTLKAIGCTACEYCLPCPSGVHIPRVFDMWNSGVMYGVQKSAQRRYNTFIAPENRGDMCVECGQCETLCPQQLEIIEGLKKAHRYLTEPIEA